MHARDAADLLLLGAVWGGSYLFMRIAAPEFGPVPLIAVRVWIAAVMLGGVLAWRGQLRPLVRVAGPLWLLGALNTAIPFSMFAFATLSLPAGVAAVLNATVPLFGALTALAWLGERIPGRRLAGIATGFAGVLVLAWPQLAPGATRLAVMAALAASVQYAVSAHYTRQRLGEVAPLGIAGGSQVTAAVLLAVPAYVWWPAASPSPRAWLCAVALGVACTGLAYALYFRLLARAGPSTAMAVTYLIPVFGVTWGALVLGERVGAGTLAGGGLILAGVAMTTWVGGHRARSAGALASPLR